MIYVVSGILLGTAGGFLLGRFELERYLSPWVAAVADAVRNGIRSVGGKAHALCRIRFPSSCAMRGASCGACCRTCWPASAWVRRCLDLFPKVFSNNICRKIIGSPCRWRSSAPCRCMPTLPVVPVIQVFVAKGIPLGTAVAFMMGVVGLSLPEAAMLKKSDDMAADRDLLRRDDLVFILSGYVFNMLL